MSDDGGGDDSGGDGAIADGPGPDVGPPPGCTGLGSSWPQCWNGLDDDGDGYIDSADVECTFPRDQAEGSFAFGIPAFNDDPVTQDCFFDCDSGAGNDGCNIHVCCLLGATTQAECPLGANRYDPMECPSPFGSTPPSQMCIDVCGALTLPGCDCFGCCTLCDPATNQCADIAIDPNLSPSCTLQRMSDPSACKRCQKTSCGDSRCGGATCILCPGQDLADLAPDCGGTPSCPSGAPSCANGDPCPSGTYCHAGSRCCVGIN